MKTEQEINVQHGFSTCEHKAKLTNIKKRKRRGDISMAAEILGISLANAQRALERVGSKYHDEVVAILDKAIKHRLEFREKV